MASGNGPSGGRRSSSDNSSRRVRHCRALFVLGSGYDPAGIADSFADRYRRSRSPDELNFGSAVQIVGAAANWADEGKSAYRNAALEFVRQWCETNSVPLDEKLVLVRRFTTDDGRALAVAGYFPESLATPSPAANEPATQKPQPPRTEAPAAGAAPIATALSHVRETARSISPASAAMAAGAAAVVLILYVAASALFSGGAAAPTPAPGSDNLANTDEASTSSGDSTDEHPRLAPPQFLTGVLRVYTDEPGFGVLIDGNPAVNAEGQPVTTPCAITVQQGSRAVTLVRDGWFDTSRQVDVAADSEVSLYPTEDSAGTGSEFLNAPHREAKVGVPIALESLNSQLAEFDPFITPDGLSIWFAGDRPDGRGVFVATRPSPWHGFDPPELVQRKSDLPASPSVTSDGLTVAYAIPKRARLLSMARENPLGPFGEGPPLLTHDGELPNWLSSQILGDGRRLYWVEEKRGELTSYAAKRDSIYDDFGKPYVVTMPGTHPCMSQDGLRQYVFDGRTLKRYRRTSPASRFVFDRDIAELSLDSFRPSTKSRQFAVSGDEQWLFYCDDPDGAADLFMLRLSKAPQWGVPPLGKQIAAKVEIAAVEMQKPEEPQPATPEEKPVDPASLPLPYEAHWKAFSELVSLRQYDAAAGLLLNAKKIPAIQPYAEPLRWDEQDLSSIRDFWTTLENELKQVEPGTSLRVGTRRSEFVAVESGELVTRRADQEVRRKIAEFDATELSTLFDELFEKDDALAAYRFFVLLSYDAQSVAATRERRREQAGRQADEFQKQLVHRQLRLSRGELERSNFASGVRLLKIAKQLAAETTTAVEVQQLEDELYSYIKWQPRGPRKWLITEHEFAADAERLPGSILVSELKYQNFQLSLEWKTQDLTTAQGGVYFRYDGGSDLSNGAFKIHLANDAGGPADQYSTGSLFTDTPPDANVTRAAGEWNSLEMSVRGDTVEVTINDRQVLTATAQGDLPKLGLIALDGVNGGITYRNVLISELPAE
jgi:hypothetical protein